MTEDDVERIFAKLEKRIAVELCSFGPNKPYDIGWNDGPNWMRYLPKAESVTKDARAALSAMPQRELLAEALDALTPFAVGARSIDVDPPGDHEPSHGRGSVTAGDLRRARAAADKIRAALEHQPQQKGEGL